MNERKNRATLTHSFSGFAVPYRTHMYSLRTKQGVHFFPRIFYLLFAIFNFYNFSFPFGFSYSALGTSMAFMLHSMLFFWHRYELPAVVFGLVSPEHPRQSSSGVSPVSASNNPAPPIQPSQPYSESGRSTPENTAPSSIVPNPRRVPPVGRSTSFSTVASGALSRNSSAGGLFHAGGGEDDGSYMFFMDGEVVTHRNAEPRTPSPFSPAASQTGVDPAQAVTEPRRNHHRASTSTQ